MRTYQHIIDTASVKSVLNSLPNYWVLRDLSERDYGIDLMIEIFTELSKDRYNHKTFEATGQLCYLQIKGTDKKFKFSNDDTLSYSIDKSSLLYVEKFSNPFFLVRVSTRQKKKAVYFLWLQRYIMEVLDFQRSDWRESSQDSFTVHIPLTNSLPHNFEKI